MNVTKLDIEFYLHDIKKAIKEKRYRVSSREKNQQLFLDYCINENLREKILLSLEVTDFCKAVPSNHPNYPHEILYIFGKDVSLLPRFDDEERVVSLYIKINKLDNLYCIVISFHEQQHKLSYAFK